MSKIVLVHSGGLDSTVLLYQLRADGHEVATLSVNYGQRHARELDSAAETATGLGLVHRTVDLRSLTPLWEGSCLVSTNVPVPDGQYTEETMTTTVVPNRNMILLAVAAAWAISLRAEAVAYAAHGGDHAIYPDCRPEFADALGHAIALADLHRVKLLRPFVDWTKAQIVRRGAELGVPFSRTWSCYRGGAQHCGRCGTCIERREAFHLAGVPDPTTYAADAPSLAVLLRSGGHETPGRSNDTPARRGPAV